MSSLLADRTFDFRICGAIRLLKVLEFDYDGGHRVVHPYCHGISTTGAETLRAVQVAGRRGSGLGYGKLWTVAKIRNLRETGDGFVPDDPHYNPDDSAMAEIHCRVDRGDPGVAKEAGAGL